MFTLQKAFLLLAVVVCRVNGQSQDDESIAIGTAEGAVGLPGGRVETGTAALVGVDFSVAVSGTGYIAPDSTSGAPARLVNFVHTKIGGSVSDSGGALVGSNVTSATIVAGSRADDGTSAAASSVRGTGRGRIAVASGSVARTGPSSPSSPSPRSSPSSSPMGGRRLLS